MSTKSLFWISILFLALECRNLRYVQVFYVIDLMIEAAFAKNLFPLYNMEIGKNAVFLSHASIPVTY